MKRIRLFLEYACSGIWIIYDDGVDTIEPEDLPVSVELQKALALWNRTYQATYDSAVAQDSGFSSTLASRLLDEAFNEEGAFLLQRLKDELPDEYDLTHTPIRLYDV